MTVDHWRLSQMWALAAEHLEATNPTAARECYGKAAAAAMRTLEDLALLPERRPRTWAIVATAAAACYELAGQEDAAAQVREWLRAGQAGSYSRQEVK